MERPPPGLSTVAQRLDWLVAHLGWSRRALSLKAGLADGHVASIIRQGMVHVELETVQKLARAAGVSLRWLATGEGLPDDVATPPQDTPAREWAVEVLRGGGVPEDVIQGLLHEQHDEEHDRLWWLERGVTMARLRAQVRKR